MILNVMKSVLCIKGAQRAWAHLVHGRVNVQMNAVILTGPSELAAEMMTDETTHSHTNSVWCSCSMRGPNASNPTFPKTVYSNLCIAPAR